MADARAALGVTRGATPAQVATAFRRRARTVHPDVSQAHDAADRFAALVTAYQLALGAARHTSVEGADVGPGKDSTGSGRPPLRRPHDVVTGPAGTAVWEQGQPILLVTPASIWPTSRRR